MKQRTWMLVLLPLALAACAAEESQEADLPGDVGETTDVTDAAAPGMEMGAMATTVTMSALADAAVSGEAILTPAAGQTEVSVTLNGLEPNAAHPGHIHQGSCEAVGAVVVPLTPITADASGSGTMTTTAPVVADSVMAGGHIVVYHDPGGTPIVCGAVVGHVM